MTFVELTYWDIALAALLLTVNAGLSIWLRLGMERQLAIAAIRMVVQLTLVGLVLKALFATVSPWLTGAVALVMIGFAGYEATARQARRLSGPWGYGLGTMAIQICKAAGANAIAPLQPGDQILQTTTHTTTFQAKFIAPWWRVQPYVSLGLGAQYSDVDFLGLGREKQWMFVGRPAGGIDAYLTKNLVLFGEVAGVLGADDISKAGQDLNDLWYLSIGGGIQWRF